MTSLLPAPEPDDPVEGQPGHFEHSNWLKASVKALDAGVVHKAAFCPIGTIVAFAGTVPLPDNWKICDGTNGTPDLRGKFILGASDARPANSGGGAATVTLSAAQSGLRDHGHTAGSVTAGSHSHGGQTLGDLNQHHHHMQSIASGGTAIEARDVGGGKLGIVGFDGGNGATPGLGKIGQHAAYMYAIGVGDTTGAHVHGMSNDPGHTHDISVNNSGASGATEAHENMPPYWALVYIMRVA